MFLVYDRAVADVEPTKYVKGAASLGLGVACKMTSGQLAKCAAADMPEYIINGPQRSDGTYPVIRVLPTTVFETTSSATTASTLVGTAVQMNGTADGVTATSGGAFVLTYTDGVTNGGVVRGYFKQPVAAG